MKFIARHDGEEFPVEVERHGSMYRVRFGERWIEADLVNAGRFLRSLRLEDGTQFALIHHREGNEHEVTLVDRTIRVELTDPLSLRRAREDESDDSGSVRAMMPGRIVRVMVAEGAAVKKGAGLVILEAMKMENEVQSPRDGVVSRIFVAAGDTVEGGAELLHVEGEAGSSDQ